ncbi:MAG: helix-turn-helix transcriptional regulator [Pseudomonadota bacterium]
MKSEFGKYAQVLRIRRNATQSELAKWLGVSLSHVSNLEAERAHISKEVVEGYVGFLGVSGFEAERLQKLADLSNNKQRASDLSQQSLLALIATFGDQLSDSTVDRIRELVASDIGAENASLRLSTNQRALRKRRDQGRSWRRPSLTPERFVRISLLAEAIRRKHCDNSLRLPLEQFLAQEESEDPSLGVLVLNQLPSYAEGAFAIIVGSEEENTILLEEEFYSLGLKGSSFVRHVVAHEFSHHVLHKELLFSAETRVLPPQDWARQSAATIKADAELTSRVTKRIDNFFEVEAECFATMLLVPWTEMMKGTESYYLAKDFGEEKEEINRYLRFIRSSERVRMMFEAELRKRGT